VLRDGLLVTGAQQLEKLFKLLSRKIAILHPLDGYYNFNVYHLHIAFYFILMCWCPSALCCVVDVLYKAILRKRILSC